MTQILGRLICAAAFTGAVAVPTAHAVTVIDFEPAALTGLYVAGDSFVQGDYTFTTRNDFGIVDTAAALGSQSPTGNATQFYFNANDGALRLARTDGTLFSLNGFSAAFVPLDPASAQTTVIVALGTKQNNSTVSFSWAFASSATSHFPFSAYSNAANFAAFTNLKQVDFYACSLVGSATCTVATQNNGQFAIDDIRVTPVPEPTAAMLLALGLAGLALRARSQSRSTLAR